MTRNVRESGMLVKRETSSVWSWAQSFYVAAQVLICGEGAASNT